VDSADEGNLYKKHCSVSEHAMEDFQFRHALAAQAGQPRLLRLQLYS
jgi:hypothetical protein